MEIKRNVSGVMMVVVVLIWGMYLGQISAQATSACYSECMTKCTVPKDFKACRAVCILKCSKNGEQISTATAVTDAVLSNGDDTHHKYCVLGCAYSKCAGISTPTDPHAEEVEGCVKSCDESCISRKN
ncbi:hypothetical protein MKW94_018554 [Papaver nudicaule]|uniref:Thionin-like protein 2 n=1 Tax=Papaver nudicaule TaxID=74823 RepID=A0AA41RSN6_PAPNU|nr:hypothetical protein [Papaver nudicaule]